jgi:Plasmid encoded RepA protein
MSQLIQRKTRYAGPPKDASPIFFGADDQPGRNRIADWARFHFFDRLRLWFHNGDQRTSAADGAENAITLSQPFCNEIDQHRIPVEREVIAAFAHSPGVLDFYIWLVWKSWAVNGSPPFVPCSPPPDLAANWERGSIQPGASEQLIGHWLRKVRPCSRSAPLTSSRMANA